MEFGYFTLSDNHYADNSRKPNQFVIDIPAEALYAEQIGIHSAWIGEHHFNSLRSSFMPRSRACLRCGKDKAHPPRSGGNGAAIASPDPHSPSSGRRSIS